MTTDRDLAGNEYVKSTTGSTDMTEINKKLDKLKGAHECCDRNAVLDEVTEAVEDEMHEDYPSFDSLLRKIDNLRGKND